MASLKRDTPAGRAALARRRQRAAAVVDHNARFSLEEGTIGTSEDSNQSPPTSERGQQRQQAQKQLLSPQKQQQTVPPPARSSQRDPPPQQKSQQYHENQPRSRLKDPPQRVTPSGSTSYSATTLPSSDELLKRSSKVAQTAASVLASARKTKNPHRDIAYVADSKKPIERERYVTSSLSMEAKPQLNVYETPLHTDPKTIRIAAECMDLSADAPVVRVAKSRQPQQQAHLPSTAPSQLNAVLETRSGREDQQLLQPLQSERPNLVYGESDLTIEEREPVISKQTREHEALDATCLRSGTWVMLRSMAASAMVSTTSSQDYSRDAVALVGGSGLGAADEVFQLVNSDDTGSLSHYESSKELQPPLRWGDHVALLSFQGNHSNDSRALGVRKRSGNYQAGVPMTSRIAWFGTIDRQVETWTLLRGHDDSKLGVRVGLSASQAAKTLAERRAARGECTRVVQSGDPILLRHDLTGGLLSVTMADGSLDLVSDSYNSNRCDAFRVGSGTSHGLIGQLQMHDRYLPMDQDTFSFVLACVPPCPRWILGGGLHGHRMYLQQTYLTESQRNSPNQYVQEKLFGNMWSSLGVSEERGVPADSLGLADQESVIIDEVLGACLGLEGRHIGVNVVGQKGYEQSNCTPPQKIVFRLSDDADLLFDASLRNLAEKMLPLGASYSRVSSFVAWHLPGYEHGSVMQAFCEALDGMLQEYGAFVANLEDQFRKPQSNQNLTLRKLHAHLMPSLHTMAVLEKATFAVRDKTGGSLLNSLTSLKAWSCEGDLVANSVLDILIEKSSIPYMRMLTTWLQHGLLQDPYREFMIEIKDESAEQERERNRSLWQNFEAKESFVLKEEHVLTELGAQQTLVQKVVATGKYWRAVKTCEVALRKKTTACEDGVVEHQAPPVLQYCLSFGKIACFIQSMYDGASMALVKLLMQDFNLMDSLRSIKQYFLLDHGNFLTHFLDSAEDELLKELGDISTGRIQHWLRMSVQLTELQGSRGDAATTPSQSLSQRTLSPLALRCRFQPTSLIEHIDSINLSGEGGVGASEGNPSREDAVLGTPSRDAYGMSNKGLTGVETFVLDFPVVPFPVSMVLSDSALSSYQLLFRLLFFAKYVERRLLGIWQDHQAMKELNSVRGLFGPTFLLRQRMLHFAQNLSYYFLCEVIEPNWSQMEKAIKDPATAGRRTVDSIIDIHEAFLQRTLEACLLTNRELVRTLTKLMTTCLMFADQMKLFTEATRIHDESSHIAAERRKAIQRRINDRGGGGTKLPVDKNALREAIHSFKQDRQTRLKKQKRRVGRELSSESYRRMVGRFDEVFSAYLSEFMLQLNGEMGTASQEHKTNLGIRLDYNGFLSSSIMMTRPG